MRKVRNGWLAFPLFVLLAVSLACAGTTPAVPPTATSTAVPPTATATATLKPTSTPRPTATSNLAATQETDARLKLLQTYVDAGYISSTAGQFEDIEDFHETWAKLGYFNSYPLNTSSLEYSDLVFEAHFQWETAAATSDLSGCGIIHGYQPNGDFYAVFVDKARILYQMVRNGKAYLVGKTRGTGRPNLAKPEADFGVIIRGTTSYVVVNGAVTQYTLSVDQTSTGQFAYSVLSGTNKDFGTRCNITDAYIWTPDQ